VEEWRHSQQRAEYAFHLKSSSLFVADKTSFQTSWRELKKIGGSQDPISDAHQTLSFLPFWDMAMASHWFLPSTLNAQFFPIQLPSIAALGI
jgi:hypothetical protein